jgi:hypothetical protein
VWNSTHSSSACSKGWQDPPVPTVEAYGVRIEAVLSTMAASSVNSPTNIPRSSSQSSKKSIPHGRSDAFSVQWHRRTVPPYALRHALARHGSQLGSRLSRRCRSFSTNISSCTIPEDHHQVPRRDGQTPRAAVLEAAQARNARKG